MEQSSLDMTDLRELAIESMDAIKEQTAHNIYTSSFKDITQYMTTYIDPNEDNKW